VRHQPDDHDAERIFSAVPKGRKDACQNKGAKCPARFADNAVYTIEDIIADLRQALDKVD